MDIFSGDCLSQNNKVGVVVGG